MSRYMAMFKGKGYLLPYPNKLPVYYKKYPWTQPVLTSNSSYGTITCSQAGSSHPAWHAFNGDTATWWEVNKVTTGWLMWKLPEMIWVTGISITTGRSDRLTHTVQVYADEAKTILIGESITNTAIETKEVQGIPEEGVCTDTLYFDLSSPETYPGINEIVITAHKIGTGTKDDYDMMTEKIHLCTPYLEN